MENGTLFRNIMSDLNLGSLISQPQRVSGGYLHKMYCLETSTGKYAVKLLNPAIMKRPGVFQNYQKAECLELLLQEHEIPIVAAIEISGQKMQCTENQFYYLFPWVEGRALRFEEIKAEHCDIVGALLARIHSIEQSDRPHAKNELSIDWDAYIEAAQTECSDIADQLKASRELLYSCQKEWNSAQTKIPTITCICNIDMDSKNVLWLDGAPVIIDLECLDYGNPFWDMFQLALSWSGGTICRIDYALLETFILSYRRVYGDFQVDWNALYASGFGWLEWLEYNTKRALMIECTDEEEREMGISEVHATLHRIIYYDSIKDELLRHLC